MPRVSYVEEQEEIIKGFENIIKVLAGRLGGDVTIDVLEFADLPQYTYYRVDSKVRIKRDDIPWGASSLPD